MPSKYPIAPVCVSGNVARVTLPCGNVALVDADKAALVSGLRWRWYDTGRDWRGRKLGYPCAPVPGKSGLTYINRLVTGAAPGAKVFSLSGDRLDCRRANLVPVNLHHLHLAAANRALVYFSA